MVVLLHVPIHIRVNQTEDNRLIAYQRLVVTFGITNRTLIGTTVRGLPPDRGRMPILVLLLLDSLDPIIGDIHRHAVIEAIATILEFRGKPRHSTHFLGDRDRVRVHLMNQLVRQCQISDRVTILMAIWEKKRIAAGKNDYLSVEHNIQAETVEYSEWHKKTRARTKYRLYRWLSQPE